MSNFENDRAEIWEQRYQAGDTPWDKGAPHPELDRLLRSAGVQGRAIAPGCGAGHDVRVIANLPGVTEAVGLDIAPAAVRLAEARPRIGSERYILGDFFQWGETGSFDWLVEHTCFCALPPSLRGSYIEAATRLVACGGGLAGIFYINPDLDPGETGPPFGIEPEELHALFAPAFELVQSWIPSVTYPGREGRELACIYERRCVGT